MQVSSLSPEEVEDLFEEIKDDHYIEKKEQYEEDIQNSEDERSEIEEKVDGKVQAAGQKDSMTDICLAPFIPSPPDRIDHDGGAIAEQTDWEVKAIEPLRELDITSPDILLANTQTGEACSIVCMPRNRTVKECLQRLRKSVTGIRENTVALKKQINVTVEQGYIYPILAVPEKADNRARDEIEDLDDEEGPGGGPFIFRVDMTQHERLGLVMDIRTRSEDEMIPDGEMGEMLVDPIEVSRSEHSLPNSYSYSHKMRKTETFAQHNVMEKVDTEPAKTHFSRQELEAYFKNQRNMAMSNGGDIVEKIVSELLDWWVEVGLVKSLSPSESKIDHDEVYRFETDASGSGPAKIIRGIQDECEAALVAEEINIRAKRKTLQDFDEEQHKLQDFYSH